MTETVRRKEVVAICKDVLQQMRYLNINPGAGYLRALTGKHAFVSNYFDDKTGDLQKYLPFIKKNCTVCAIGSCFLSYVKLHDNVPVKDFWDLGDKDYQAGKLIKFFYKEQLDMIEAAYELTDNYVDWTIGHICNICNRDNICKSIAFGRKYNICNRDNICKSIAFGRKYLHSNKRLCAILRNVIKNNGEFKP